MLCVLQSAVLFSFGLLPFSAVVFLVSFSYAFDARGVMLLYCLLNSIKGHEEFHVYLVSVFTNVLIHQCMW